MLATMRTWTYGCSRSTRLPLDYCSFARSLIPRTQVVILERECAARAFELSVLGMRYGVLLLSGKKGIFPGHRDTTVISGRIPENPGWLAGMCVQW